MSAIGMILERLGQRLVSQVAPQMKADYLGGQVAMTGLMAIMAGEAWDGAAERLATEIKDMRHLFDLADRPVGIPVSPGLRLSDLTRERDGLAEHLIQLQTEIETLEDERSKEINRQIWLFYMQSARARMPSPPQFPESSSGE